MAPKRSLTANGVYRVNAAGLTQVRVNDTGLPPEPSSPASSARRSHWSPSPEAIDLGALSTFASQAAATVQ
jgi:hypothetical protein